MFPILLALAPTALGTVWSELPNTDAGLTAALEALDAENTLVVASAIDPWGEWIVVSEAATLHASAGFDPGIVGVVKALLARGNMVEAIDCHADGTCMVSWPFGTWANGPVPADLLAEIDAIHAESETIRDFELAADWGWVVVDAAGGVIHDGVDAELVQVFDDLLATRRTVQHLEIGFDGRWALVADQNPMFGGVSTTTANILWSPVSNRKTVDVLLLGPADDFAIADLDDAAFVPDPEAEPAHLVEYIGAFGTIWSRMSARKITGAAVALVRDGEVVSVRGYGMRDRTSKVPMLGDTPVHVASLSKLVGSLVALRVIDEIGHTPDTDLISTRVPGGAVDTWLTRAWWEGGYGFPDPLPSLKRFLTYRGLMSHTASILDYGGQWTTIDYDHSGVPLEDWLSGWSCVGNACAYQTSKVVWQDPSLGAPGDTYAYSNRAYTLLQAALEDHTGASTAELVQETLIDPLGLEQFSASYPIAPHVALRMARNYDTSYTEHTALHLPGVLHGGMVASAGDFARVVMVALNEGRSPGGEQLVPADGVARMLLPIALNGGTISPYGFGVGFESTEGASEGSGRTFLHNGLLTSLVSSYVCGNPTDDAAIVVLTNTGHATHSFHKDLASEYAAALGWTDDCR